MGGNALIQLLNQIGVHRVQIQVRVYECDFVLDDDCTGSGEIGHSGVSLQGHIENRYHGSAEGRCGRSVEGADNRLLEGTL